MNPLSNRFLWATFLVGALSPLLAVLVKPEGYSFYFFFPALPVTITGRLRLVAGNTVLVLGFAVSLIASLALLMRGIRLRKYLYSLPPLLVFANPFQQPIFLESLNDHLNQAWRDRVTSLQLIGKTPDDVRRLLGSPIEVGVGNTRADHDTGNVTWHGEPYTKWYYHPLRVYWVGARCRVFFVNGRVKSFNAE